MPVITVCGMYSDLFPTLNEFFFLNNGQTASTSLFGISTQQTKCVKQTATPPIPVTNLTNLLKLVRLVWVDNRSIVMLTVDGKEQKYSV